MNQKICNILERATLLREYQVSKANQAVFGSIAVVDALTRYVFLHFMNNLKAAKMNV